MVHAIPVREVTQARAARIAGALYVLTNLTAIAGYGIRASLGGSDAATTAQIIRNSEWLYRLSIAADLVTIAGVIVLVWALHVVLRPVNRDLALLATLMRLMENAILAVMAVLLLVGLRILSVPDYLNAIDPAELHALARLIRGSHGLGFTVGFLFLGLGSVVFAYLFWTSRYVPRPLAGWGLFASSVMASCALGMVLFPAAAGILQLVSFTPMGIYEVVLGGWLFVKTVRIPAAEHI